MSALHGVPLGSPRTLEIVARVGAHHNGGQHGVPVGARVVVMSNTVERLPDRTLAYQTAGRLLRAPALEAVVCTTRRGADPVRAVCTR